MLHTPLHNYRAQSVFYKAIHIGDRLYSMQLYIRHSQSVFFTDIYAIGHSHNVYTLLYESVSLDTAIHRRHSVSYTAIHGGQS